MATIRTFSATLGCLALSSHLAAAAKEPSATDLAKAAQAAADAKPDWWDQVSLNYPKTLDLSCPKGGKWNPNLVPGQWTWDVVNPNAGRWKEGTKFWHMVLSNAKDKGWSDAEKQATGSLSHCYGELLQDWPRAYYWLKAADAQEPNQVERMIKIAHCEWQLGSPALAKKSLKQIPTDTTRHGSLIKLWADLGEYDTAYRLAKQKIGSMQDVGWFMIGYTAQLEGDYAKALAAFAEVEKADQAKCGRDWKQTKVRAQSAGQAITLFEKLNLAKVADGTYRASSTGYNGPVEVTVVVKQQRITDVSVSKHQEKQYYASLTEIPAKIIAKQHVKDVDATLGATITAEAIVYAAAKALNQGQG